MSDIEASVEVTIRHKPDDEKTYVATAAPQFGNPGPVGFGSLTLGSDYVFIHSLVTRPDVRRRGVATKILAALLKMCDHQWPARTVYLTAVPYGNESTSQEALFTFYGSHGFVRLVGSRFEMFRVPNRN